eukprot:gnl/MRDRNA2_/MRDRNA2_125437_c0_seq1.p1 gnl/MRDRNA2_/MRDRNA2_125437_c0~~gnl/MRDRNA2_/MRDRNA2_125437_c0_seq1.p1  ORF type:complete len:380 (-),score=60.92 gnl/MRDRNA2_/MRDRNA2_125437_c0_seq1:121-1260(-)
MQYITMILLATLLIVVHGNLSVATAELKPYVTKHCGDLMLTSVAFSANSQQIAAGSWSYESLGFKLQVFNLTGANLPLYGLMNTSLGVQSVAYSMDGKWLATASAGIGPAGDNITRIFAIQAHGQPVLKYELAERSHPKSKVVFSADSKVLVSLSIQTLPPTGTVQIYFMEEDKPELVNALTVAGQVANLALSPDGNWLALLIASDKKLQFVLQLYSLNGSSKPILQHNVDVQKEGAWGVAFSADSHWVAVAGNPHVLVFRTQSPSEPTYVLKDSNGTVANVAFSSDGKWLASGSEMLDEGDDHEAGKVRLYALQDDQMPKLRYILSDAEGSIDGMSFSPDSKWLVAGSWNPYAKPTDGKLRVYQVWHEENDRDDFVLV